jgi:hypothetical protein
MDDNATAWKSSAGGEAAWKEAKLDVASRNADARTEAKREREEHERTRRDLLRAAEVRRRSGLPKQPPS